MLIASITSFSILASEVSIAFFKTFKTIKASFCIFFFWGSWRYVWTSLNALFSHKFLILYSLNSLCCATDIYYCALIGIHIGHGKMPSHAKFRYVSYSITSEFPASSCNTIVPCSKLCSPITYIYSHVYIHKAELSSLSLSFRTLPSFCKIRKTFLLTYNISKNTNMYFH